MPGLRWTAAELMILECYFEVEGRAGCARRLPGREPLAIAQRARKLGLVDSTLPPPAALRPPLAGHDLDRALALHDQGWSYAAIGREFNVSDSTASNAVLAGKCIRAGHTPAERDRYGHLLPAAIERIRAMLRAGLRGTEIQLRTAVSAGCVAQQRRNYAADLKARGKKALPPPGGGEAYSGARVPRAKKLEAEQLLLEGLGAPRVSDRTGVSRTHVLRIRTRLIKRLARKGECLPGCDRKGRRTRQFGSKHFIPADQIAELRRRLLTREPVRHAALATGIGGCSAYRIRDALAAELEARGEQLPPPILPGRRKKPSPESSWLPPGQLQRYRNLVHEHGAARARQILVTEIEQEKIEAARRTAEERARPLTFAEQLDKVRQGATVAPVLVFRAAEPDMSLAGSALGGNF
jgi:hypothetical protein